MLLERNNNQKIISRLAVKSLKGNKRRNFFTIFTIALSVSLLTFMAMFVSGVKTAEIRQVAKMQHVIYYNTSKEQLKQLAADERIEQVAKGKTGPSMEVEDYMLNFSYTEESTKNLEMLHITEGTVPQKETEIAVQKEYLKKIGKPEKLGTKLTFTFLDGTSETFEVVGFIPKYDDSKIYSIAMSEAYAEQGNQLKEVPYMAIVRLQDARSYSKPEFLDEIRTIASEYGIAREDVNENNYFTDTLSGDAIQAQQTLMATGVGIGILFVSVLVIYSVFYLSVIGRIRQFGQFVTIGMTKKQIRRMIRREGLLLSLRGIPIGLFVGIFAGYLVKRDGWDLKNTILIAIAISIVDVITVLLSIQKPAKIASAISPIEAAKFSGYTDKKAKKETKQLYRKMTPFSLAKMSSDRNRKKSMMTMLSLGIGGILFMLGATMITGVSLEEYARSSGFQKGEYHIGFSSNAIQTLEHGMADIQLQNPINDELIREIRQIDGVKEVYSYGRTPIEWTAHTAAGEREYLGGISKEKLDEINLFLEEPLEYSKFQTEKGILIKNNSVFGEAYGWKFSVGDKIQVSLYNGKETVKEEYTVMGLVSDRYQEENSFEPWFLIAQDNLDQVMGGINSNANLVIATEREKEKAVGEALQSIVDKNPLLAMDSLEEKMIETEKQFSLLFSVILGLAAFIIAFSLINLVNTLITNIVTRKQEFAMLESIGMSEKQLNRMIQGEGFLLAAGNSVITLLGGIAAGKVLVWVYDYFGGHYIHYHFPIWYFLGYAVFLIAVPMIVSKILLRSFEKESLVERIRIND